MASRKSNEPPGTGSDLFSRSPESAATRFRECLSGESVLQVSGCYDALSARIIERAGFQAGFLGCAQAGLACIMIEDQLWPKRCGHTAGKSVVDRGEAVQRIKACVRIREEHRLDILIMARTDANAVTGFDEALWRLKAFIDAGADITFLEAPENIEQMERYGNSVPGWKTVNLVEDGQTPWLDPAQLTELGYALVLYPVSLLLHSAFAMQNAAALLSESNDSKDQRLSFNETRNLLGWPDYEERLQRLDS